MATLKIANWNIEWMNRWFTGDNAGAPVLKPSSQISGVTDIDALATRVANVITGMNADILTVQEGPSRKSEMALFVAQFLGDAYDIAGPVGKGQQKVYALIRKQSAAIDSVMEVDEELGFDFADDEWDVDIDGDMDIDLYSFTRPPLVIKIGTTTGQTLRLLTVHTKSKFVHRGRAMWRDPMRRPDFVVLARKARRRISAEALRIREFLNACFAEDPEAPIIVTGDLNDGPGLDFFERRYLTHNVAGMIAGSPFQPGRMLRHAFVDTVAKEQNFTAIFDDFIDEIDNRKVLLDHILVSARLFWKQDGSRNANGTIEHELFDEQIDGNAAEGSRQHLPSDHRPQSVTLDV